MKQSAIDNLKAAKAALALYEKMGAAIEAVTDDEQIDWSCSELLEAIYAVSESDKEPEALAEELDKKKILHGSKTDVTKWVTYISEYYRNRKGLSSSDMLDLFRKNHVLHYLSDCYPALHTVSEAYSLRMIDDLIKHNGGTPPPTI